MDAQARHRRSDLLTLVLACFSASTAAPFMAAAAAPSLAIAFWRNGLAVIVLLPLLLRQQAALRSLPRRELRRLSLAGMFLGVHFACWVPSVKLTSIASATSLVATQVVWAALMAWLTGRRPPRLQLLGIALTLCGVVTLTGLDFALSPQSLQGDLLALLGAVLAAAYMHVGRPVRSQLPLAAYTGVLYLAASLTLLVVCAFAGVTLVGFSSHAWLLIAGVTLFAQFGGHSLYNKALRSFSATAVSNAALMQVPIGTLIGWAMLGQTPAASLLPAAGLVIVGVVLVVRSEQPSSLDPDAMVD